MNTQFFVDFVNHLTPTMIVIAGLGVWRLASLVANENGAWHMFKKFRRYCARLCRQVKWCRQLHLYELVTCEWCNSVWFGGFTVLFWLIIGDAILVPMFILALSSFAIGVKFVIQNMETALEIKALLVKKLSGKS